MEGGMTQHECAEAYATHFNAYKASKVTNHAALAVGTVDVSYFSNATPERGTDGDGDANTGHSGEVGDANNESKSFFAVAVRTFLISSFIKYHIRRG